MTPDLYDGFILEEDTEDNGFEMWQGRVGPHYTPDVDSLGNLSWSNNGDLQNPPTVNIMGKTLAISGIVSATTDLPASSDPYAVYLVGTEAPFLAYIFNEDEWVNAGPLQGPRGPVGDFYGVCMTYAGVAAKTVSISDFVLETGVTVHIRFYYGNNVQNNLSLNINDTGAKPIYQSVAEFSFVPPKQFVSGGETVTLTYIGNSWVINNPRSILSPVTPALFAGAATGIPQNAETPSGGTYLIPRNTDLAGANYSPTSRVHLVPGDNMQITSDDAGNVTFTSTLPLLVEAVNYPSAISISAGSGANVTVNATKSGYHPIGIVGINTYNDASGSNWNRVVAARFLVSTENSNELMIYLLNTDTANAASVVLSVYVLYMQD